MECQHFRTKGGNWRSLPAEGYKDVSAFIVRSKIVMAAAEVDQDYMRYRQKRGHQIPDIE